MLIYIQGSAAQSVCQIKKCLTINQPERKRNSRQVRYHWKSEDFFWKYIYAKIFGFLLMKWYVIHSLCKNDLRAWNIRKVRIGSLPLSSELSWLFNTFNKILYVASREHWFNNIRLGKNQNRGSKLWRQEVGEQKNVCGESVDNYTKQQKTYL